MRIGESSAALQASTATVADTQRHLSLRDMFPEGMERKPFKTADHKVIFLDEPAGGVTAQVDRREGRYSGLRQWLGCGAQSDRYTGQSINICVDREQFEGAYERLVPKLFDSQSPVTRFKVINALAPDSYESLGGDTWISLCLTRDVDHKEILSYLAELGEVLKSAEIEAGQKPETDVGLRDLGGYFSYAQGSAAAALEGFELHYWVSTIRVETDMNGDRHEPLRGADSDSSIPTHWDYTANTRTGVG
jgi:hypothetical protein